MLLVRLESLTQEQFTQLSHAVGQGTTGKELLSEVRRSRAEFDATVVSLRQVSPLERKMSRLPQDVRDFRRSADRTFAMVGVGEPALAVSGLADKAAPTTQGLLDQLSAAADASGAEARRPGGG